MAEALVTALQRAGFAVWWDVAEIPPGVDWSQYLADQVSAAPCVLVLWSQASVQSKWVRFEAEIALRRGVMLPVLIDEIEMPAPFSRVQAARLPGWDGDDHDPSWQRLLMAVHRMVDSAPADADMTRIVKSSQRSAELRAEELFQHNLRRPALIEHVDFEGTAFHQRLVWNVCRRVNVLLGRNGFGKTLLLRSLVALLQYDDEAARQTMGDGSGLVSLVRDGPGGSDGGDGQEEQVHFVDHFFDEDGAVGRLPLLAIPDTRFLNRSVTTLGAMGDEATGGGDRADLARFGARHLLQEKPYENMIQSFLYGLCLDYFEDGLSFRGEQFTLIREVVRELTDQSFDFERVAREGRDRFTLYVRTEGNEDRPLPIQKCSQGTLSAIAMFGLIHAFLKSLRHDDGGASVLQRRAIVIIDEVDAHLHPSWQQKVVTLLRDRFPAVQFILTAHNPIVVAGCREDEVSVLRKGEHGGFVLLQFPNHFIGWSIEDIYRKVFDIENPDTAYTRLDAMRPFKGRLQQQAQALAGQSTRSAEQERSLQALEEQLLYIDNVEGSRSQRIDHEALARENKTLQERLLGLASAHEAAAQAQHQVDRLRAQLQEQGLAAVRRLRRTCVLAVLATAGLTTLVLSLIGRGLN